MGEKQVSHGRGSSCLRSGDLGSKHSFATVTPGDLGQCLFLPFPTCEMKGLDKNNKHFRDPVSLDS